MVPSSPKFLWDTESTWTFLSWFIHFFFYKRSSLLIVKRYCFDRVADSWSKSESMHLIVGAGRGVESQEFPNFKFISSYLNKMKQKQAEACGQRWQHISDETIKEEGGTNFAVHRGTFASYSLFVSQPVVSVITVRMHKMVHKSRELREFRHEISVFHLSYKFRLEPYLTY